MKTCREKFYDLHQKLSNCRSELVLIRLGIGKRNQVSGEVLDRLLIEEKRLISEENRLEQELKNLLPDKD